MSRQPSVSRERHRALMRLCLDEARRAPEHGDVPVGAVLAINGRAVSRAHNRREVDNDPSAHAELLALRRAADARGSWRLDQAALYVTLEPCPMCAGALVNARVRQLFFGCKDPKAGAVRTLYTLCDDPRLNHQLQVTSGLLADECTALLADFFKNLRRK